MVWPERPVESIPPDVFVPPHCPWRNCSSQRGTVFRYHRHGVYLRDDGRVVPRFRCLACRRTCSQQTFAFSYYLKRPELAVPVAAGLNAGSAHRQLSRSLGCAPSTVTRLSARLGRHALLLSSWALQRLRTIDEPVVFDHFETFVGAQDHPVGVATAVGQDSWFCYGTEPAPHRRRGRMTPVQKARQERLPAPASGSYRRSVEQLVGELAGRSGGSLRLISDDHPAYRRALSRMRSIRHEVHPNPSRGPRGSPAAPEARRRDRAMFANDLLHKLIRHTCAHHRRETIAFSRRLNALLERIYLLMVWRNFVKRRTERRSGSITPAMRLELTDRPWSWQRVLAMRCFPFRIGLGPRLRKVYLRQWPSGGQGPTRRHALAQAF